MEEKLQELKKTCVEQLFSYPNVNLKKKLVMLLKMTLKGINKDYIDKNLWPNGLILMALALDYKLYHNDEIKLIIEKYFQAWKKKKFKMTQIDNALSVYALMQVEDDISLEKIEVLEKKMYDLIINYPIDDEKNLPYRKQRNELIYIDTLGIVCPFLCKYGVKYKNKESIDLGVMQFKNFLKNAIDSRTGLPYHGYNTKKKYKEGIIGWGRGIGWILIGLIECIEILREGEDYEFLKKSYQEMISKVMNYQTEQGFFTWQLECLEGHIDSSATSMIGYSLCKAMLLNILGKEYSEKIDKITKALDNLTINGKVNEASGECGGFSVYPQKYDSYPWSIAPTYMLYILDKGCRKIGDKNG